MGLGILLGPIFTIIGIGILINAIVKHQRNQRVINESVSTTGTVVEMVEVTVDDGEDEKTLYTPRVKFALPDGREVEFVDPTRLGKIVQMIDPGTVVDVHYDPNDPDDAHVTGRAEKAANINLAVGVVMLVVGVVWGAIAYVVVFF
jgi:hypothetical protein